MNYDINLEKLRNHSIFVGTPMFGGVCTGYFSKAMCDLSKLCEKYGIKLEIYYLFNESLIQRARNYIVDTFLRSSCTHLMFIDADILFNPKDILLLLAIQTSDPEKYNVITGPYAKKVIAWEKVLKAAKKGLADNDPKDLKKYTADLVLNVIEGTKTINMAEPLEISEAGTGFMMIPRETFDKYKKKYPEYSYKPDHIRTENFDGSRNIMAYFDCAIDKKTRRYLSEDYFFCQNVRKAKMKVYTCPWIELHHIGSYVYSSSIGNLAQLSS